MKYGEIISLGRHRLMCGDATKSEDVHRLVGSERVDLVLTDPPYGMKRQHKDGAMGGKCHPRTAKLRVEVELERGRPYPHIIGDDTSDTARLHYPIARTLCSRLIFWGGQYFADFLPVSGGWIFWDKRTGKNDFSDGELAWCSFGKRVRKYTQTWNGVCMGGSYKLNARNKTARIHPTQKPVELHAQILSDFSREGDTILDCFGGSGTTLIACEITNRKCLMMELSPDYCDVIKARYDKLSEGKIDFDVQEAT